ncbi:alpha-1,6-mannosyl-glycoprotein 4-beta-N-acetylglucosaminyltransferase-like [Montipora foliosa]|uniref:alpha-1,6-mannosyl-glycoprotein 4-beta-N-acetylglucosaminyltransferase-like n=1 Tax=Montipora foliosa TaxID=591990 RepID=UPI0035F1B407
MRWIVKLKLFFTDFRGKNPNVKMVVLIITAVSMLCLNWMLPPFEIPSKENCNEGDFLSCSQDGTKVITKSSVREIGKPLNRKVFLTIGIPTVQRIFNNKTAFYLVETLKSLLHKDLTEEDLSSMLIVIFLADTETSAREKVKESLRSNFGQYLERNLIHVIVAPVSFYPQLKGLPRTYNDGPERMYWRSKQSMDYVFMFYYSQGLSQYYLHLEDDVIAEPDYMRQIRDFIDLKRNTSWDVLEFSSWGFIGKLMEDKDLRTFGRFIALFYAEMPVDWLLSMYLHIRRSGRPLREVLWKTELFHHGGHQSSSLGT